MQHGHDQCRKFLNRTVNWATSKGVPLHINLTLEARVTRACPHNCFWKQHEPLLKFVLSLPWCCYIHWNWVVVQNHRVRQPLASLCGRSLIVLNPNWTALASRWTYGQLTNIPCATTFTKKPGTQAYKVSRRKGVWRVRLVAWPLAVFITWVVPRMAVMCATWRIFYPVYGAILL